MCKVNRPKNMYVRCIHNMGMMHHLTIDKVYKVREIHRGELQNYYQIKDDLNIVTGFYAERFVEEHRS